MRDLTTHNRNNSGTGGAKDNRIAKHRGKALQTSPNSFSTLLSMDFRNLPLRTLLASLPLIGGSLFSGAIVHAEHLCKGEISYEWKRKGEETPATVFWSRVEALGTDEKSAKEALIVAANAPKAAALSACKREHENVASCVATKFFSYATTLQNLSFSARKKLEEAIAADCTVAEGLCLEAKLGEPTCEEKIAAPVAAGKDAPAKDAKDAKGAKKK